MNFNKNNSFARIVWKAGKKDILLSAPWLPIYSISEVLLALSLSTVLQLIFVSTPRIQLKELIPGDIKNYINFNFILDRRDLIFIIPVIIICISFAKLISSFMSSYLTERAGHKISHLLRQEMLKGYLTSSGNILDKKNPDSTANQLMQDTALLQGAVSKGTISAARDFVVLLGFVISMLLISWKSFLIGISILIPMVLMFRKIAQKLNFYTREGQKKQIEISSRILSTHGGLLTINALRCHKREELDFENLNQKNYQFMKKSLFVRTFFSPGVEFFAILLLALIFNWRVNVTGEFLASTYSSMLILLVFSFRYIKNIAATITFFSEIQVVLQRVKSYIGDFSYLNSELKPKPLNSNSNEAVIAQNIFYEVDGITLLSNCNIKIKKGKKVAFIGDSGAGKTTFLRTLAGLILPTHGNIQITHDFLLALQTPYVYRGTIKENIVYAEKSLPEHIVDDRCKELILGLRLAYSTSGAQIMLEKKLGFLGEGLSGGEKARVALARTVFASPKLILLDEPTANLDAESALLFWQTIHSWQKKDPENTVIAVSHAIKEIENFDECYLFENGKIIKHGAPKDIIRYA